MPPVINGTLARDRIIGSADPGSKNTQVVVKCFSLFEFALNATVASRSAPTGGVGGGGHKQTNK